MARKTRVNKNKGNKGKLLSEAGFGQYPKCIARMTEVSGTDKQVLYVILERIRDNGSGESFPKQETIAREAGCGRTTVHRAINKWKDIGLIEWQSGADKKSNNYIIKPTPKWIIEKYGTEFKRSSKMSKGKIEKTILESLERTRKAHKDKEKKRISKVTFGKDPNVLKPKKNTDLIQMQNVYTECFVNKYDKSLLPKWTGKEIGQAKGFIKGVGGIDTALLIVKYVFKNWKDLSKQWKIDPDAFPTIGILCGFAKNLSTKLAGKKKAKPIYEIGNDDGVIFH